MLHDTPTPTLHPIHRNSYHHPAQLLDGKRAVRSVRSRLRPGVDDAARVGVVGSSAGGCAMAFFRFLYVQVRSDLRDPPPKTHAHAGGHLSATVAAHHDGGNVSAFDPVDRFRYVTDASTSLNAIACLASCDTSPATPKYTHATAPVRTLPCSCTQWCHLTPASPTRARG